MIPRQQQKEQKQQSKLLLGPLSRARGQKGLKSNTKLWFQPFPSLIKTDVQSLVGSILLACYEKLAAISQRPSDLIV